MKNSTSKGSMTRINPKLEQSKFQLESSFKYRRRIKEQTISDENKKMFAKLMKIVSFDSKLSVPNTIVVSCKQMHLHFSIPSKVIKVECRDSGSLSHLTRRNQI